MHLRSLVPAVLLVLGASHVAVAQAEKVVSTHGDWEAVTFEDQSGKVCFARSEPKVMKPNDLNHGKVVFFVSTRPRQGVASEPSLIAGYPFKENSRVDIDVDGKTFNMFTKGDGAWVENAADESRLVSAMKAGRSMNISATSGRGNSTSYTYSLSGITAALNAVAGACK